MPKATVSTNTESFDLKSIEGGTVKLKRMSYGESVQRRAMMKMSFISEGKGNDFAGEMAMASVEIQTYEFSKCVVEHNLYEDDAETVKINLTVKSGLDKLDPRVGQEIEQLISKMNDFESDEDAEVKN